MKIAVDSIHCPEELIEIRGIGGRILDGDFQDLHALHGAQNGMNRIAQGDGLRQGVEAVVGPVEKQGEPRDIIEGPGEIDMGVCKLLAGLQGGLECGVHQRNEIDVLGDAEPCFQIASQDVGVRGGQVEGPFVVFQSPSAVRIFPAVSQGAPRLGIVRFKLHRFIEFLPSVLPCSGEGDADVPEYESPPRFPEGFQHLESPLPVLHGNAKLADTVGKLQVLPVIGEHHLPLLHLLPHPCPGHVGSVVHLVFVDALDGIPELLVSALQKGGNPGKLPTEVFRDLELALVEPVMAYHCPGMLEQGPHLDLRLPVTDRFENVHTLEHVPCRPASGFHFPYDVGDVRGVLPQLDHVVDRTIPELLGLQQGPEIEAVLLIHPEVVPDE